MYAVNDRGNTEDGKKGNLPPGFFKMGTVSKETAPSFEEDEDEDEEKS